MIVIFLLVFLGIIAFCIAGGITLGKQESDIRKKLLKKSNEEKGSDEK